MEVRGWAEAIDQIGVDKPETVMKFKLNPPQHNNSEQHWRPEALIS
jgi:hypothetical protein